MKRVFTFYYSGPDAPPHQAGLIKLWDRSWTAKGFETRLLTLRHARSHKQFKSNSSQPWSFALSFRTKDKNCGWFIPSNVMNFSLDFKKVRGYFTLGDFCLPEAGIFWPRLDYMYSVDYGIAGWKHSDLVIFPREFGMDEILNCGRAL